MAAPTLEELLNRGVELGLPPDRMARGVTRWQSDLVKENLPLSQSDPERFWGGLTKINNDVNTALLGLKGLAIEQESRKFLPEVNQRKEFLKKAQAANFDLEKMDVTPDLKLVAQNIADIGNNPSFKAIPTQNGTIGLGDNPLAVYEIRSNPVGPGYAAYVRPTQKGSKPFVVPVSGDREALLKSATDEQAAIQKQIADNFPAKGKIDWSTAFLPAEGQASAQEARANQRASLDDRLKAWQDKSELAQKGDLSSILHVQLNDKLKNDQDFLKTIPQNSIEQFTTRPLASVARSLAQGLAGATGVGKDSLTSDGQEAVNVQTPGRLRSRFAAGENTAAGDQISQGIESAITLFGPSLATKGLTAVGGLTKVGKSIQLAGALEEAAGGMAPTTKIASQAGWGSFFATAYGANYAGAQQEADAIEGTDPARAARIRNLSQWASLANAGLEMASEKIFPDEARLMNGQRLSLGSIATIPFKEAIEEYAGTKAQNVVNLISDQSTQDPLESAKGGFLGSIPMLGGAVIGRAIPETNGSSGQQVSPIQTAKAAAVATNDPAAAAVLDQAENLSTVPIGQQIRNDLSTLDINRPISDEYAALQSENPPPEAPPEITDIPAPADSEVPAPTEPVYQGSVVDVPATTVEAADPVVPEQIDVAPTPSDVAAPAITDESAQVTRVIDTLNSRPGYSLAIEQNPDKDATDFAAAVKDLTGRSTVFVRGQGSAGAALPGGNTVVVNLDSPQGARKLIGHEVTHTLEGTPEFDALRESILKSPKFEEYANNLRDLDYSDSEIEAEFVADVVGENLATRSFWRSLSQEQPGVFRRMADATVDFIQKIRDKFKKTDRLSASPYVADLKAAQGVIKSVLRGLKVQEDAVEAAPVVEKAAPVTAAPVVHTEDTIRKYGRNPDKLAPEIRSDAVAALNGDELALARLNIPGRRIVQATLADIAEDARIESGLRESRENRVVTPQQDAEYLKAVEDGDVEKQQAMVDAATKPSSINGKEVFNSLLWLNEGRVYPQDFGTSEFAVQRSVNNGDDFWDYTRKQGSQPWIPADTNPVASEKMGDWLISNNQNIENIKSISDVPALPGFPDNEYSRNAREGVVAYAKFFESSDPVTYDNQDNVIPLSQRFNSASNDIRESRDKQQRFGNRTTLDQEVVREEDVQSVVDSLLANNNSIKNASESIGVINSLGTPTVDKTVNAIIRQQFADYLKTFQGPERAAEVDALRAFVYMATLGRTIEQASILSAKGKPSQKSAASKLIAVATEASRKTLVRGSLDPTTVARVLRFTKLMKGGDVANMLYTINSQMFEYVDKNLKIPEEVISRVSEVPSRTKAATAKQASYSVTKEGKVILGKQKEVVKKINAFAKFLKSKLPKESREGGKQLSAAQRIDEFVASVEEDYANVDEVISQMVEYINTLPIEQQEEATRQMEAIMAADNEVASAEKAAGEPPRKLNQIASRMIDSVNKPRLPGPIHQDVADFAAIRNAVRERTMTPEEAVAAFEALGGDPVLSKELRAAFENDKNSTLDKEQLKTDAQKSKDLIKEIGDKVAKEEDFQKNLEKSAEKAAKEASDRLIKEVGEDVAKGDAFQEVLQQYADQARKEESDRLMKEVGEDVAKAEDFQARIAKENDAEDQRRLKAASRVFGKLDSRKSGPKQPGLSKVIEQIIMSHPEWDVSNPADQQQIIAQVLIGKGYTAEEIKAVSKEVTDAFNTQLEKLQRQEATVLMRQLGRGKVTQDQMFKAIRLHLLDKEKGIGEILAAQNGWKGLSPDQLAKLYDIGERARQATNQQVRVSLLLDQMRVIYTSSGISPERAEILSAGVRASAYGGLGSIFTNATAPVTVATTQLVREFASDVIKSPTQAFELMSDHVLSFAAAVQEGYRSGLLALTTESTKAYSVSKDTAAAGKRLKGVVDVDALTRQFDRNLAVIRDKESSTAQKVKNALELVWSSQRVVWKVLGAADSLAISLVQKHLTTLNIYRQLRKAGEKPIDSRAQFEVFLGAQEAAIREAVTRLGLSPNAARLEAESRIENAYFDWLSDRQPGIMPRALQYEALREAVTMLGNHAEVQGKLSMVTNRAVDFFADRLVWGGIGPMLSSPIRIVGNIADMAMWWSPGYGIYRAMREKSRHKVDAEKGIIPGQKGSVSRFTLSALSDRQLQRRLNEGIAGTVFTLGLIAALALQSGKDDDDKELEITTAYPATDPAEQARWRDRGLKEYTVYLGKGPNRLSVAYTRGAFDYMTFPLAVASRYDRVRSGKATTLGSITGMAYDVLNLATPVTTNNARSIANLQAGKDSFRDWLAGRVSSLQPYSALTRSIGKLTEEPLNKAASGFQWSTAAPVAALFSDEGEVTLKNVLDEPVEFNTTFWQKLAVSGFPIVVSERQQRTDPKLRTDFEKMNYVLPMGYTYNQLVTDVGDREAEVLQANGVDTLPHLFERMNAFRAMTFKEIYADDPAPSSQADDQRFLDEILLDNTPLGQEAYKKRMSKFWSAATRATKEEFQITEP